ncbi:MAG: hypothetical protein RLZZ546_2826 [Bacteroidota bacterium]|jgi:hypothetical protein
MKSRKTIIFLCAFLVVNILQASMICPPDKYLSCDADIDNLYVTGKPSLFGSHKYYTPKYEDQYFTNGCNVGHVLRKWYIDLNNNDIAESHEPICYQDIYLENDYNLPITIKFPSNIEVNCLSDIPDSSPDVTAGPCDLIGVSYYDQVFDLLGSGDPGCKKVLRKFTVINWCNYNPNNPNSGGIWYGTQVIKIVDKEKPQIVGCKDVTIGFNQGCKSLVTLTNKATDNGNCASEKLFWVVDVDLYQDGIIDYVYSNASTGEFFLNPISINEEIKIKLPGAYPYGKHKVLWKVKDSCGNLTSCLSQFTTIDNKPPTPYCHQNVSVAIDGEDPWPLKVPASMFNLGAFDNCTAPQFLRFSFSTNVADSIKMFNCTNAGFNTIKVYATDIYGNSDYCEINLVIYDHGSCGNSLRAAGLVTSPMAKPMKSGKITMLANSENLSFYENINEGSFAFENIPIYNDAKLIAYRNGIDRGSLDLVDMLIMRKYLMSIDTLPPLGFIAGDINEDKRVNAKDYELLKNFIINEQETFGNNDWKFIPSYINISFLTLKNYNPIFDTKKFKRNLDFIALAKGDMSEAILLSEGREQRSVSLTLGAPTIIDGESYTPILFDENIDMDMFQLDLFASENEIVLNCENKILQSFKDKRLKIINPSHSKFKKGDQFILMKSSQVFQSKMEGYGLQDVNKVHFRIKYPSELLIESVVYPNPASQYIHILSPEGSTFQLYNANGQILKEGKITMPNQQLEISDLMNGVYFLKLGNLDKVTTKKILKY